MVSNEWKEVGGTHASDIPLSWLHRRFITQVWENSISEPRPSLFIVTVYEEIRECLCATKRESTCSEEKRNDMRRAPRRGEGVKRSCYLGNFEDTEQACPIGVGLVSAKQSSWNFNERSLTCRVTVRRSKRKSTAKESQFGDTRLPSSVKPSDFHSICEFNSKLSYQEAENADLGKEIPSLHP